MQRLVLSLAAAAALGLGAGPLFSGEAKKPAAAEKEDPTAAMARAMAPGPNHKHLNALVGTWKAKAKFWMAPDQGPMESEGTMVRKWIMDGRFVQERYQGKAADLSFEGLGLLGYDNLKKKYTYAWVDSMSTALMTSTGTYDPARKTFTYTTEGLDPYTGMKVKTRDVARIISKDENIYQMFKQPPGGKEFKVLEIIYTRKK